MDFGKKLQELRKGKGLTQEELAEVLYVSRTAVSKWESGRGYPNIESLKDISKYFGVSIDCLLSGESLLDIAETENKYKIRKLCNLLYGIADLFSILLVVLPLYPDRINDFIYSVTLLNYTQVTPMKLKIYWASFVLVFLFGVAEIILAKINVEKGNKVLNSISFLLNIFLVFFLALAREAYAVVLVFLILIIKAGILFKIIKHKV